MLMRAYTPADEPAVRTVFRETVALGRPCPFELPGWRDYERLCLGWCLGQGAQDVGVLDESGSVLGYTLVCTDLDRYRRWLAGAALAWSARTGARLAAGRLRGDAGRFHRLRLRDGWAAARQGPAAPMPACVHLNLRPAVRAGRAALALVDHADARCRLAGHPGWYGEVNALEGRRARALVAGGLEVVHRQPNRTLSWLAGRPVERLTVVRTLGRPVRRRPPALPVPG
jgi:hypothetical protein